MASEQSSQPSQSTGQGELSRKEYMERIAYNAFTYGFVPIPIRGKIPVTKGWTNFRNNPIEDQADIMSGKYPKNVRRVANLVQYKSADNVGIVTGEASGVVVIDIDTENNGVGVWDELVEINSPTKSIPETFTVQTPSGGRHYYFKYTPDLTRIGNINRIYRLPFDYRTTDGMVVYPGSSNKQGIPYTVAGGYVPSETQPGQYDVIIAEMPSWLRTFLVMDRILKEGREVTSENIAMKEIELGIDRSRMI